MGYTAYPELKESGISWLGKVPTHWQVDRAKWGVTACKNGIWGSEADGEDDIVCVRVADFDRTKLAVGNEKLTYRAIARGDREGRLLKSGDLLLEKSGGGDLQPVGVVVQFAHSWPAVTSNFVARMPMASGMNSRFFSYAHAHLYAGRVNVRSIKQTTGIQNLDSQQYLDEPLAYPPLPEQQAIARFLDHKTAQIDALIAKKQALLQKLAEKRTALISHAVTKGFDPSAPMKHSGIEWIGDIPTHWQTGHLRRFAQMRTGHTPSRTQPEYWFDCTIPWFTLADVWQLRDGKRIYLEETKEQISELGLANSAAELLPAGTVIFSRTASIGFSGIMPVPMATTQDFWNWICGPQLLPEYLLFAFRSMRQEFEKLTSGSTHKTIYQPDAAGLRICVPPISEQHQIAEYIKNKCAQQDEQSNAIQCAVERLKEYRSALITAAVTGKIDVRDVPVPEVSRS